MSAQKRERSINFSREEVEILTSLVAQHKTILENKKSDSVTWLEKEKCWKSLEEKFNSTSGSSYRSVKTLKAKYDGIKRATRKTSAAIRAETYRTGGGPNTAPPLTPIEEKVKEMILISVDGTKSQFDSDCIENHTNSVIEIDYDDSPTNEAEVEPPNDQSVNDQTTQQDVSDKALPPIGEYQSTPKKVYDETNDENKWTNWKPKSLRSKKHPALIAKKVKRPFERVADSKLEIAELQKTLLEEELLNKKKQWAFEEEEREHKKQVWVLEKKYWLNKM